MISLLIFQVFLLTLTFFSMVVFHELGHYFVARELGGKTKIRWGGLFTEVSGLSYQDLIKTYWGGIIAGFIPLVLYLFSNGFIGLIVGGVLLQYYVWIGCSSDVNEITRLNKVVNLGKMSSKGGYNE